MLGLSIPFYDEEGAVEQVLHQTRYVLQEAKYPFFYCRCEQWKHRQNKQ